MPVSAVSPVTMPRASARRAATDGALILGGGFGGAHVARLLGDAGATIVDPEGAMLFTPPLPEVAAGAVSKRSARHRHPTCATSASTKVATSHALQS